MCHCHAVVVVMSTDYLLMVALPVRLLLLFSALCLPCVWGLAKMILMMPTAIVRGMVASPGMSDQSAWWTKACPAPASVHIVPGICFAWGVHSHCFVITAGGYEQ